MSNKITGINLQKAKKMKTQQSCFKKTDITKTQKYQSDEKQLKEDRNYFESLFTQAKNGNQNAVEKLSELRPQDTVQVNNSNDRLLNSNTSFLLRAQNEIKKLNKKDGADNQNQNLNQEQENQKNLILEQLKQDPENNDITEADVQNFILEEQLN